MKKLKPLLLTTGFLLSNLGLGSHELSTFRARKGNPTNKAAFRVTNTTTEKQTKLHKSVLRGDYTKAEGLLNYNNLGLIDRRDKDGYTALHYAAREGYEDLLTLLLNHDANINITSYIHDLSAIDLAWSSGYHNCIKIIVAEQIRRERQKERERINRKYTKKIKEETLKKIYDNAYIEVLSEEYSRGRAKIKRQDSFALQPKKEKLQPQEAAPNSPKVIQEERPESLPRFYQMYKPKSLTPPWKKFRRRVTITNDLGQKTTVDITDYS